jgi:hypothetical protein
LDANWLLAAGYKAIEVNFALIVKGCRFLTGLVHECSDLISRDQTIAA